MEQLKDRLSAAQAAAKAAVREKERLGAQDSELRARLRDKEKQLEAMEKAMENDRSSVNSEKLDRKRWKEEAETLRHQLQRTRSELATVVKARSEEESSLQQEHKSVKDLEKRLKYVSPPPALQATESHRPFESQPPCPWLSFTNSPALSQNYSASVQERGQKAGTPHRSR